MAEYTCRVTDWERETTPLGDYRRYRLEIRARRSPASRPPRREDEKTFSVVVTISDSVPTLGDDVTEAAHGLAHFRVTHKGPVPEEGSVIRLHITTTDFPGGSPYAVERIDLDQEFPLTDPIGFAAP